MLEEGVGIVVEWPEEISLNWSKRIHEMKEQAMRATKRETSGQRELPRPECWRLK